MWGRAGRVGTVVVVFAAVLVALAGCGSAVQEQQRQARAKATSGAPSAQIPRIRPLSGRSGGPAGSRLVLEVNDVCRAVRQGAPPALQAPYTPGAVGRYVSAAAVPTRRTVVSLQRLSATGGGTALEAIAGDYAQLQATYASARLLAHAPRGAQQIGLAIQRREQSVTAQARADGAPACGVAGR